MSIVKVENLVKKFNKVIAINDISFEIEEGEIFGFLGPNGAGKSTTIKILATIVAPTSGKAQINGFDILTQPQKVRQSIGIVFQEPSTDELLTAYENLYLSGMVYGVEKNERKKRIEELLEFMELEDRKNDLLKTFSGGMRRRLEIARALLHQPKILFLDEPTIGLDPNSRRKMWDYIKKLNSEFQVSIFLTTHYMEEADYLSNRVGLIDRGKIITIDKPQNLKKTLKNQAIIIKTTDIKKLQKIKYVKSIEELKDNTYKLNVENIEKTISEIFKKTKKLQLIEIKKPTLEDVFIALTKHEQEYGDESWFNKIIQLDSKD
jgi:ABC-2 type transport system ATP-binding protein